LRDKGRWYLEHGVSVVWLVFPDPREVLVLSATGEQRLAMGQTLPPDDQLPNLQPAVAQLFAQLDR
jgi:Uma2 family endonuclease